MSHVANHVQRTSADEAVQPCSTNLQHPSKSASKFTDHTAEICYKARNHSNKDSINVGGDTESVCEECEGLAHAVGVSADVECVTGRTVNDTKL